MFSKRGIERLAGGLLVVSLTLFLGHIVTLLTLGTGLTTIVFVLFYGFPVSLAGLALYMIFRVHDPILALFSAFGFVSHGLFVVLAAALLLAGLEFPQEFATFGGGGASSVAGAASALELSMDKIRTSAFVFLGLGVLPLGVLIARSGAVARWVGWLGLVAGFLGFFGLLAGLAGILGGLLSPAVAAMIAFAFMLTLGVRLIARETHAGGRTQATA